LRTYLQARRRRGDRRTTRQSHLEQLLADYEPAPLDPAIDESIRDFVARRKREGGLKTD
jgi:trimethylamine:corrinoid methyltransferase-like protein